MVVTLNMVKGGNVMVVCLIFVAVCLPNTNIHFAFLLNQEIMNRQGDYYKVNNA